MLNRPRILLQGEGAVVFVLSLFFYHSTDASWGRFLLLFLWPDLSMAGYAVSVQFGSRLYNLVHNYIFPLALAGVSFSRHEAFLLSFSLIWLAHIGFDRGCGYGLKYPTFFKDTHLQRVS